MIDAKLKKRLNDLYRLATHEATPINEKTLAQTLLNNLMQKHGIKHASEFTSDIHSNDVSDDWIRLNIKVNPFSRTIAMIVGSYTDDTIIFNGNNCIMYKKESTDTFIKGIMERYKYHIDQIGFKNQKSDQNDYSNGFRVGVMTYFEEKKISEAENSNDQIDNSEKLMPISQKLEKIIEDNAMPVSDKDTNMGRVKDQRFFMLGIKHGHQWDVRYLNK